METISRLVVFSLCVTALCRLSASTPYEKYVRFLGAILMGAQLVGIVLAMVGQQGENLWHRIEKKGIGMETGFYGASYEELGEQAEEIRQQLWTQSENYWSAQLQEPETENEEQERMEILPVVIQVGQNEEVEGETGHELAGN